MSGVETLALALTAAWLLVLSIVVLLNVRQLALVMVAMQGAGQPGADGLPVGTPVPRGVTERLPALERELAYLLFVSPTCGPCVAVMDDLATIDLDGRRVLALFPGDDRQAEEFAHHIPASMNAVRDPVASEIAELMNVRTTPFALQIEEGIVSGKAVVQKAADLENLIEAYEFSDAAEIAKNMREVVESAQRY